MSARARLWLVAALVAIGLPALGGGPKVERLRAYKQDHLIVKFRDRAGRAAVRAVAAQVGGRVARRFRSSGAVLVKLGEGVTVDAVLDAVRRHPAVAYAERDHYLHISAVPDDPDFESCWGLHNTGQFLGKADADIDAPEAWDLTTGSANVIVAVIDTGVDYSHEDLAANMWTNAAELNGQAGVDDDSNGYVDDIHGIAVLDGDIPGDPMDEHGHGTHVAGILGAVGDNARGMVGVNWSVKIMALRFMDANGYGLESDAATCIEYAAAHGAQVLNNSYGGDTWSQALHDAIADADNTLFCAAAGNDSMNNDAWPSYPASYDLPNIISVAATGGSDNLSYFSNYGATSVHVGAPGESIWSTWPGNRYQLLDGTSMACPFVSGVAALVLAANPGMPTAELRERVLWTGDPLFDLRETTVTGLRVNAYNAVAGLYAARITTPSPLPAATEDITYNEQFEAEGMGGTFTWSWSEPPYVEREVGNGFVAGGTAQTWQADERVWELDLSGYFPDGFPFYGTRYDRVWVCSNGYLQFAETRPAPDEMADMPRMANKTMIAPYWCDLTTTGGDVLKPNDIFIGQPDGDSLAIRWQAEQAEWLLGFQINVAVVLHADGRIDMHYGECEETLVGGVVGVSSGDGSRYRASTSKTGTLAMGWAPSSLWVEGQLPPGLTLYPDGAVGGIPTGPGVYCFDVTAEDAAGGTDTKGFQLKVYPAGGPQAAFEAAPLRGTQPLEVNFSDLSTGTVTGWHWEFGDGTTSDVESPSHTYAEPGQYTVVLTVTGPGGSDTATKLRYIEVLAAGVPCDFEGTPTLGTAPLAVHFEYLPDAQLDPLVWSWYFGDGAMEAVHTPTIDHTFEQPGEYDVILVAMDATLQYGTCTKLLYVTALPPGGNAPPEATDDDATMAENAGSTDLDVLANDSDPDGDPLTITEVTGAAHGVVVNHESHLAYTPDPGFAGQDSLRYEVSDGRGGIDHASVAITVSFVNDPPILIAALPDILVDEDDPPSVIDLANHFDDPDLPAGDVLTASVSLATAAVSDVAAGVDEAVYTDYLDNWLYTHDGHDRGPSGAEHDLARDNIQSLLGGFGLAAALDPFRYSGETWHNVVAVQPGVARPEDIYVVGAHYDSVSNPGADDNASGVAGVLEAARVLSRFDFEASLAYIAFDMEETGLHGSRHYAQAHADESILGMVSLDMIAYNPEGSYHNQVAVYQHDQLGPIADDLEAAFGLYGRGVTVGEIGTMGRSDHEPFEDEGFDAALVSERASNPHYHDPEDSMDTPDY
ncbi:MAG: S8 family serine peptidase, partial [Planctomycetota bacterium]